MTTTAAKRRWPCDLAIDYPESCPPNAILFSFEDNDTLHPLWYAQEVEVDPPRRPRHDQYTPEFRLVHEPVEV